MERPDKNKLSALFEKPVFRVLLLAAIIIAQLSYDTYIFLNEKMGFYGDEVWSYSIANYFDETNIYDRDGFMGEFQPNSVITEYIAVQPGERFNFSGVFENSARDLNPPLYYCLLHFICSLFPEKYSVWFTYVINLISMAGIQIFLYLTGCEIFREKKYLPFVCCLYYAFSRASLDTAVFMRMYAMLTFFTLMNLYFQFRVMHSESEKIPVKYLILSFVTGYLGFMTQSMFPAAAGIMTAMVCIRLIYGGQIKKMFVHGFTMLSSLILYAVSFRAGVDHVLSSGSSAHTVGAEYPFVTQFRSMINYMIFPISGYKVSFFNTFGWIYLTVGIVIFAAVMIPVCILFRNSDKFRRILKKIGNAFLDLFRKKNILRLIGYDFLTITAVCLAHIIVCAKIVNYMVMQVYGERYLMSMMPIACIILCMAVYYVIYIIRPIRSAAVPAVMISAGVLAFFSGKQPCPYLFNELGRHEDLTALFAGKKAEIVVNSSWECIRLFPYLTDCSEVRFIESKKLNEDHSLIECFEPSGGDIYAVVPFSWYDAAAASPKGISDADPPEIEPYDIDRIIEEYASDDRVTEIERIIQFDAYVYGEVVYRIHIS